MPGELKKTLACWSSEDTFDACIKTSSYALVSCHHRRCSLRVLQWLVVYMFMLHAIVCVISRSRCATKRSLVCITIDRSPNNWPREAKIRSACLSTVQRRHPIAQSYLSRGERCRFCADVPPSTDPVSRSVDGCANERSLTAQHNHDPAIAQMRRSRVTFLPARRYASAGYSDRNVSVRLSVCPSRASIVSKRRKLASWFLHHLVAPRL